uniref:Uncharacterized protein n=1 Tax=Timema bartmani TaxID=61472 RepID=A0A7R9I4Z6_9NEOP|nr:unnamed protein product [Timema bartmani]
MQQRGLIFFFVVTYACAVYATKCASDACDRIVCDATITEEACDQTGGQFREKGSLCHCCSVCIPQTDEGSACNLTIPVGFPPPSICKPPLECIDYTCKLHY